MANNKETFLTLTSDKRETTIYGLPADGKYRVEIEAFRVVDQDIDADGVIESTVVVAPASPYQPSPTVSLGDGVLSGGTPIKTVVDALKNNGGQIIQVKELLAGFTDLETTFGNTTTSKTNADAAEAAKLVAEVAATNATTAYTDSQAARDAAQASQVLASGFATNAAGSASHASGSASTATTAAALAAQAKLDAMAAFNAAQTASDLAHGFSNQAADNFNYAFQAMGAAQIARDASQAARDVASEASTQAYANAQASQRYVGDAQGWASNASGHASTASQQATASSQSAEAANASSMAANTKAGEASISAAQAISAKNDADGYRNSAATSANVSASNARDAAANSANENRAPGAAPSLWSYNQYNTFAPTSRITDDPNNYDTVNGNLHANDGHVHPVAPKRVQPGHRYRAYVRFRMLSDGEQSAGHYLYVTYFDAAGNLLYGNTVAVAYSLSSYTVVDGYQEITTIIGPNEPGAGRMPDTVAFARIMYRLSGQAEEIALLYLEDVEGELAAASSALASATNASNAATSKVGADEAASASITAKTAAETARGDAQTFASQASSSKDTAAGSASTATQQAGVSASSAETARQKAELSAQYSDVAKARADDAHVQANAASGSASTAAASQQGASQSAEAASASASTASTKAGEASASAATAVSAKNDADGYRNSAASSASLAATTYNNFIDLSGNGEFTNGTDGWRNTVGIVGVGNSAGRSGIIRTIAGQNYNGITGQKINITSDTQRFKLRISWRCAAEIANYYMGAFFYRADDVQITGADGSGNYPLGPSVTLDSAIHGWVDREVVIGKGVTEGSPYGGTRDIPADAAYFRPVMYLNYLTTAGSVSEVDYFTVEDITSESNAATAAKASFDSAQTASASATLSGQNASASDGSRIAAETARGLAETYRNQAAQSRDDAAGSSSSASTASGIAVSAKDAANQTALHLHPTTFEQGELFFAGDAGHPIPQGVTWNSGTYTTILNGGYGVISWKSAIPHVPGNFYRIRARVSAPGADGQAELRVSGYSAQVAPQGRLSIAAAAVREISANTWSWIELTTGAITLTDPWIKPEIVLSYPNQTVQVSIAALELLDVTSEVIAKDAAVASSNSASSASASNDQAGQRASAADTSRQLAAGSAGEALAYRNTTADYANNAQGSANTATSQAGIATQAKVDASNRATDAANLAADALRYANASSASASTASSKASESGQSATASDLSRQQAAGSAGDALAYRNTSADYASSAQGSSSNATTQAGIATTASFRAANEASKTVVADWNDLNGFVEPSSAGGLFNKDRPGKNFTQWTSFPVISEGKVLQVGNGGDSNVITTRGSIKIEAGKFYSLTGRTRLIQAVTNSVYDPYTYFGWCGYDAAGTYLGNYYTYAQPMPVLNQWYQHDQLLSFDDLKAWVPAVAYISPMVLTNYRDEQSGLNSVMQVSALSGRDATAERNAQVAAAASAGSASTANTKASEAGQSADAANASASRASTSEGNALTYRNDASQSATNAAGSSNSAASSQGVAATAAAAASASAKATVPDNFTDPGNWYAWNAWGGSVTFENGLANIKNGGSFLSNYRIPLSAGEYYRVTARHRTINQGGGTTYVGTLVGGQNYWRIGGKPTAAVNQWETSTFEISGDTIIAEQGNGSGVQIGLLTGYPNTSDAEVSMFRIENITAEVNARNNATASASSASSAAASKNGADQSASAANTSATNALTSEGKANTSATNASRSEQNAAGSSQTASASQQLAASANAAATLAAVQNFPSTFEEGPRYFADLTGSPTAAEYPYHSALVSGDPIGPVLRVTNPTAYQQLRTRNLVPNTVAGQVWRIETKVRIVQNQGKRITLQTNPYGLGSDYSTIHYSGQVSTISPVAEGSAVTIAPGDTAWHTIGQEFTTSGTTCAWIAPTCYVVTPDTPSGSYEGIVFDFAYHRVTNVTAERQASDFATAANGSASIATTRADAAGRSAEAANQSKIDAQAANGAALASAQAANTSAVNANASASAASTSATLSSSFASSAVTAVAPTIPAKFSEGKMFWRRSWNGAPSRPSDLDAAQWTFANSGAVFFAPGAGNPDIAHLGAIPFRRDRKYRLTARWLTVDAGSQSSVNAIVYFIGMNGEYAAINTPGKSISIASGEVGWGDSPNYATATFDLNNAEMAAEVVFIRGLFRISQANGSQRFRLESMTIEDVTAETIGAKALADSATNTASISTLSDTVTNGLGSLATRANTLEAKAATTATSYIVVSHGAAGSGPRESGLYTGAGVRIGSAPARSYGLFVKNPNDENWFSQNYDVYGDANARAAMASVLMNVGRGQIVVVTTYDEPNGGHTDAALVAAMQRCGAGALFTSPSFKTHGAYILVGTAGAGYGGGSEYYAGSTDTNADAYLEKTFSKIGNTLDAGGGAGLAIRDVTARVSTTEGVLATIGGRTEAYLVQDVSAGNGRAIVSLRASGVTNSSNIDLAASQIRLINSNGGVLSPTLSVQNNNVTIAGDLYMGAGRIVSTNGAFMKVQGTGFGTNNQFIEWFGPNMAIASCSEANASYYLKVDGSAYFGGTLSAGILKNSVQTTQTSPDAAVTTGTFGSNGKSRIVTVGYLATASTSITGGCPEPYTPYATVRLYRGNNAQGTLLTEQTFNGAHGCVAGAGQFEPGNMDDRITGSITYTDNTGGSSASYFVQVSARSIMSQNLQQSLGVTSVEQ